MVKQHNVDEWVRSAGSADHPKKDDQESMERYTTDLGPYDTAINIIGGLKDCGVIFKAIDSYFSQSDSLKALINQRNEFNLRTERSRTRIEQEVRKAFLRFKSNDHRDLIQRIFTERVPLPDKELAVVWQFALTGYSESFRLVFLPRFTTQVVPTYLKMTLLRI